MSQLEDLQPNAALRGVLPNALVTVVSVKWLGTGALDLGNWFLEHDPR